ncbi:MAG TPA: hypothetical protein VIJ18_08070 [Microbacteriaceae bacterium]
MNTQLLEAPVASSAIEQQSAARPVPSTALHPPNTLERVALRVGIALIVWGRRRTRIGPTRDELARRYATLMARGRFERAQEHRWYIEGPRR